MGMGGLGFWSPVLQDGPLHFSIPPAPELATGVPDLSLFLSKSFQIITLNDPDLSQLHQLTLRQHRCSASYSSPMKRPIHQALRGAAATWLPRPHGTTSGLHLGKCAQLSRFWRCPKAVYKKLGMRFMKFGKLIQNLPDVQGENPSSLQPITPSPSHTYNR